MHKKIVRRDGSVVILVPRKESKSITWEVMFKVGSRQETKAINGVSHFIEHLYFKGTKRRPNTKALSKELDAVGAEYNAFTGKDHTAYYIQTDIGHTELGVDMLSDMLHNSLFEKKEMERERGVIVEELNMYRDNPLMRIEEVFESTIFEKTPLGMEIGGPRKVIQTVPHEKLIAYKNRLYYLGNMVVGVAGNFDEETALAMIEKHFPAKQKKARASIKPITMSQHGPRIDIEEKETEQVQLMVGFPGFKRKHKEANALMLLSVIMGGTMSSRLFITIRERKGLAYVVRTSAESYEDVGYFAVHAGLDKSRIYQALKAIKFELDKVAKNGVTKAEFRQAKDNVRGRLTLKFEKPNAYLTYLMSQELLLGDVNSLEKKLAEIEKVTIEDIHRVAKKIINWKKSNLALIGPFDNEDEFRSIISQ